MFPSGRVSQKTGWAPAPRTAWTIAEPFLQEVPTATAGVDYSGTYACTYVRNGEQQPAMVQVIGPPEGYFVRVTAEGDASDGILAWGSLDELRAIALEDGFWVQNLWLTAEGKRATGHWGTRALTCEVR